MQCQSNEVKQQTNIIRSNASEGRRANDTDVCCNFCMCVIYNSVIQSQYIEHFRCSIKRKATRRYFHV
jgi:hypothetical protein